MKKRFWGNQPRFTLSTIALAVQVGLMMTCVNKSAHAVTEQKVITSTQSYQIGAGSLDSVLNRFANQAKISLTVDARLTAGKKSKGLTGAYTVESGLLQILKETDLQPARLGDNYTIIATPQSASSTVVEKATVSNATQLPVITVQAEKGQKDTRNTYTVKSSSSAAKLDLDIKDTPQMVQVMTRQRIEDQNLTQSIDVLKQIPGVSFQQSGVTGAGRAELFARGFRITNTMFDGVSTSGTGFNYMDIWGALDTAIYDRVEMVQGSTGLMTGVGDPSASINFVRKRPTDVAQGEVSVDYGSWNHLRSTFDASSPLNAEGTVRGRLVGAFSKGDSFQDRVDSDQKTLYGVLEADVTDKTLLTVGGTYTDIHVNGSQPWGLFQEQILQNDRSYNNATDWSYSDLKMASLFLHADHEFNKNLSANLRYSYTDINSDRMFGWLDRFDGSQQKYYVDFNRLRSDGTVHDVDLSLKSRFELLGQEQQFVIGAGLYKGKMDNPAYDVSMGLNDHYVDDWNNGVVSIPTSTSIVGIEGILNGMLGRNYDLGGKNFLTNNNYYRMQADEQQKSVYFSSKIKPIERLSIILGGRYNKYERSYLTKGQDFGIFFREDTPEDVAAAEEALNNPPIQLPWYVTRSPLVKTSKFVPYAGLVFDITKDITAYASYTGIHKPNTDDYTGNYYYNKNGKILDPIEGDSKEIGLKAALLENKLNLQLTVYQMKQENMPRIYYDENNEKVDLFELNHLTMSDNARYAQVGDGGRIATGVDTNISGQITPQWFISLGYNYTKQQFENKQFGKIDYGKTGDVAGGQMTGSYISEGVVPKHQAKLFTAYNINELFKVGFGANYKSGYDDYYNDEKTKWGKGYTVFDIVGQYKINKNLSIQANIKNLFDKEYVTSSNAIRPASWGATKQGYFWGEPRNYNLSISYKF